MHEKVNGSLLRKFKETRIHPLQTTTLESKRILVICSNFQISLVFHFLYKYSVHFDFDIISQNNKTLRNAIHAMLVFPTKLDPKCEYISLIYMTDVTRKAMKV